MMQHDDHIRSDDHAAHIKINKNIKEVKKYHQLQLTVYCSEVLNIRSAMKRQQSFRDSTQQLKVYSWFRKPL